MSTTSIFEAARGTIKVCIFPFSNLAEMLSRKFLFKAAIAALLVVAACSILKKDDSEAAIRKFLASFQNSLTLPDRDILKQFETKQTSESILSAIRIAQNKEHEFITCTFNYPQAQIVKDAGSIKVVIPATFDSKNLDYEYHEAATLTLWLKAEDDSFVITKLEGDEFYTAFAKIKNEMEWSVDIKKEMQRRQPIYALAKNLQQKFDTVVWYTTYHNKNYFYVVNGAWKNYFTTSNKKPSEPMGKMGLIDEQGNIVVPVDYDLIGTIGFELPNVVEVKKNGKVGYFNIETKQLMIEPGYDFILPYRKEGTFAIVKTDSVYGWLNDQYQYQEGYPSESAQQWITNFSFIPYIKISGATHALAEIPKDDYAGNGIIVPSAYLVKLGLFDEIISNISPTQVPLNGWTDYVETKGSVLSVVSDNIKAIITTITERYLEGREEFYTHDRLVLVNNRQDTLAVRELYNASAVKFKRLDESLLEVQYDPKEYYYEDPSSYIGPEYVYFTLNADFSVTALKSSRSFPQTEFVKLDSSYLTGNFRVYDETKGDFTEVSFLPPATITYMRNEILAHYGYRFSDPNVMDEWKGYEWYKPTYDNESDIQDKLTEIDRYNLAFLEKILNLLKPTKAV
jgi:hypothetical protein